MFLGCRRLAMKTEMTKRSPKLLKCIALPACVLGLGCGAARPAPASPKAAGMAARYAVTLGEDGALEVTIRADDPAFARLTIEDGAESFITDLEVAPAGRPLARVPAGALPISVEACKAACTIRYRFDLKGVASTFDNPSFGALLSGDIVAPPTTWLLRPTKASSRSVSIEVRVPEGTHYASGMEPSRAGLMTARLDDLPQAPYAAFGSFAMHRVAIGESHVDWVRIGPEPRVKDEGLERWVTAAARDVEQYYGSYPSRHALVIVLVSDGAGVREGTALGNGGASIMVHVGAQTDRTALDRDWILTHEMVHLSMPGLASRYRWMEEGLATYLEPVMRVRAGRLETVEVFDDWLSSMEKGQPSPSDGGLDGTEDWGRVYWGGASFWLRADLAILSATKGRRSLRDCLVAVARAGGTISARWPVDRFLRACDEGAGVEVVEALYKEAATKRVEVDFEALFGRLGVRATDKGPAFDDTAPDAWMRVAIFGGDRTSSK